MKTGPKNSSAQPQKPQKPQAKKSSSNPPAKAPKVHSPNDRDPEAQYENKDES